MKVVRLVGVEREHGLLLCATTTTTLQGCRVFNDFISYRIEAKKSFCKKKGAQFHNMVIKSYNKDLSSYIKYLFGREWERMGESNTRKGRLERQSLPRN